MTAKVIPSHSIKMFRYRVHFLAKDLWKEKNPVGRMNLALQLADAASTLARLEVEEARKFQEESASDLVSDSTET
ncbi:MULTISPECIES: hypothetical protein [unclassified Microcoleus]|uniref:hypothetical protein n=1 Tax=unclassified Microcoleus TaxID=2642155 RepID=UPI002FCFB998